MHSNSKQSEHFHSPKAVFIAARRENCKRYIQAIEQSGCLTLTLDTVLSPAQKQGFPYHKLLLLDFDLLLLPGGGDFSSCLYLSHLENISSDSDFYPPDHQLDLVQFQLLALALSRGKPVLGICKGMQLINVYFGGTLYPHLLTADRHCYQDGERLHTIHTISKASFHTMFSNLSFSQLKIYQSIFDRLSAICLVNSAHHQGIRQNGEGLHTIQYTTDLLPESILHEAFPVLGLQWHPERLLSLSPDTLQFLLFSLMDFPARYAKL